jgi:hypothetical protein
MPLVRSNSGNSCSYAPLNPPDIRTFNCADDAAGQNSSVAKITNEKVFMISSSPARSRASDETIAHYARPFRVKSAVLTNGRLTVSGPWVLL